jgi:hypothetical protein
MLPQSTASRNKYPVRSAEGLSQSLLRARLASFDHSFLPSATRLCNMLSASIRLMSEPLLFKRSLTPQRNIQKEKLLVLEHAVLMLFMPELEWAAVC